MHPLPCVQRSMGNWQSLQIALPEVPGAPLARLAAHMRRTLSLALANTFAMLPRGDWIERQVRLLVWS